MLQTNNMQAELDREPTAIIETQSGRETLRSFLGFVRRQFSVILFVTLLTLALGVIYIVTARPSYTAQAQLLIDARKVQVFQQQSVLGDSPIDAAQVESQAEILKILRLPLSRISSLPMIQNLLAPEVAS